MSCRNRGWQLRGGCGGSWEVELVSPWDGGAMGSLGWIWPPCSYSSGLGFPSFHMLGGERQCGVKPPCQQ